MTMADEHKPVEPISRTLTRSRSRDRGASPAGSQNDSLRSRHSHHSREQSDPPIHEPQGTNSIRSRASSPDVPARRRVTFPDNEIQLEPRLQDGRLPGSSNDIVHLDRENPGEWVVRHHRDGLVVRLRDYKPGKIRSARSGLRRRRQRVTPGTHNDEEAQNLDKAVIIPPTDGKRFRVSFAEVQRMRIRKLQCQLVRHVVKMRESGKESQGWEETLEQYIKALQDHDYMEKRSKSIRDPFLATGEFAIDNYVLNCNIDRMLADDATVETAGSIFPWEPHTAADPLHQHIFEPICGTRSDNIARTWYHGFKNRVLLAALGGAFLIGPMWLMVLHGGDLTGLIATTGFVAVFGIIMAYFLDEGNDVLASTAAYAAVLVVFVGTSTGASPSAGSA